MSKKSFDECAATGESCCYQEELIPSEYITGVEGDEPVKVIQCKYCGKPAGDGSQEDFEEVDDE